MGLHFQIIWSFSQSENATPFYKNEEAMVMVFNDTFNNISAISWRSALLMEET
jgi:hypothetical protein